MSVDYQSLLGLSELTTDILDVNSLIVRKDALVQGLSVGQQATINQLVLPTGAAQDKVLTSDATGNATWQDPKKITLVGDATGDPDDNRVDTLKGGEIQVDDLVQLNKEQTLTNKTLTTPQISTIKNDAAMLTLPTTTDTLVARGTYDIMYNKTMMGMSNFIEARALRGAGGWYAALSGATPEYNQVLTYNGSQAIWQSPVNVTSLPMLGDVTGVTNGSTISKIKGTSISGASVAPTANNLALRDATGGCEFSKLKLTTGAGTSKVLTSDASGNATWQTPAATTSQTYKGNWSSATTYQLGQQVTQPLQLPNVNRLYLDSVLPDSIASFGTIYNGLTHTFSKAGIVTAVQIYVPSGVRPDSGYTVYFHDPLGPTYSKTLPKGNIMDGWNTVNFDSSISVTTGLYYLTAYQTDQEYAWSNNTTPFGTIIWNQITPYSSWSSRTNGGADMNTKVLGSDTPSFASTKGHTSTTSIGSGRYVMITQPQVGALNLAEIEVYQKNSTVNIAAGKSVTMSSTLSGYPGSNLTNGIFTDFAHTNDGLPFQWMRIDLGATYNIETITVYNRQPTGDASGRIKGAYLTVLNSSLSEIWRSESFYGKSGSQTYSNTSDAFLYYIINGAWSYNVGPVFTSYDNSTTIANLYEAKTTTSNNSPFMSPTQWQPILTALISTNQGTTKLDNLQVNGHLYVDGTVTFTRTNSTAFTGVIGGTSGANFLSPGAIDLCGYVLIGKVCYVTYLVSWTSKQTASGNVRIGLPVMASVSGGFFRTALAVGYTSGITSTASSGIPTPLCTIIQSAWYIELWKQNLLGGSSTPLTVANCASSGEIQISGWYLVA